MRLWYIVLTITIVRGVKEDPDKPQEPTSTGDKLTIEDTDPDAQCPPPDIADSVDWSHDQPPFEVGHTLILKCHNASETLLGPSTIKCVDPGAWWDWDEGTITCKYVVCDGPAAPHNGSVAVSSDVVLPGTTAQYSCHIGHILVGSDQLSCMDSGQWTGDAPTCQQECGAVLVPHGTFNSRCAYQDCTAWIGCDHGFFIVGKNKYTCTTSGTWKAEDMPVCTAITCSAPARIAGGTFRTVPLPNTDHQYIYQTVAMYVCLDKSHLLVGHENLTCLHTGEWDAAPPTCVDRAENENGTMSVSVTDGYNDTKTDAISPPVKKCASPEHVPYATYAITNSSKIATYSCTNNSYILHGSAQRECCNGTWSGEAPSCLLARMDKVPWKNIFQDNKEWKGSYLYKDKEIGFKFWYLRSDGTSIKTLLLDNLNAKLDLKGTHVGDAIVFETRRLLVPSEILHDRTWRVRGELTNDTDGWKFSGTVHSVDSGYSTLYMRPVQLVDYEAPPVPLDQEYASATALSLGIAIAVMAIIVAALLAAYFVKRKGGFKGHRTLTSFENPVYEYENNVSVKVI